MEATPLMQQYLSIKEKHRDEVLFFRLGDFYEMFDDDAREISRILNLTLTHRNSSPMCGIPFHAAKNYIKRLLAYGKKIAICEQLELSDAPNQIARREVVQVITPATVVEQEFLDGGSYNYLMSVFNDCCAYCDISTGDMRLKHLGGSDRLSGLLMLMEQISPSEVLVCDDEYFLKDDFREALDSRGLLINKLSASYFSVKEGFRLLCQTAGTENLAGFGIKAGDKLLGPAGALLRYVMETAKPVSTRYFNFSVVNDSSFMLIDESTRKNLELFENNQDHTRRYTLFDAVNRTRTAGGQRLLESWLSFPLVKIEDINFRQDWVKWLVSSREELEALQKELSGSLDMQRLANRVALKRSIPKDLVGIKQTLGCFFRIISRSAERYCSLLPESIDADALSALNSIMMKIDRAISEDCNGPFMSGMVVLDGYDAELDRNRDLVRHSDRMFSEYLERVKSETGITTIKIVNSRLTGYVLEVSKSQLSKVPPHFFRRQTLVNSERYSTQELAGLEIQSQQANSAAEARERVLYEEIASEVSVRNEALNEIGRFLSALDCFQSFAAQAIEQDYCCPSVVGDDVLEIHMGRHPVVEKHLPPDSFVANDTLMDGERFFLITGPNMAGKSTYLRQTALIVLLAHTGSFVPASSAVVGVTDKIFCRVGASDNLARGESTFLVEMQEAAFILRTCTRRSLVIMDEIGRGTSTQEGMSIAHAIIRFLLGKEAKTLFATHFHELAKMDTSGMALYTLAVQETPGHVKFLRKLERGSASSSYALHVARMAGIPQSVLKDAASFQKKHFADYGTSDQGSLFTMGDEQAEEDERRKAGWQRLSEAQKIIREIESFDLDSSTPFQSMVELQKLKELSRVFLSGDDAD